MDSVYGSSRLRIILWAFIASLIIFTIAGIIYTAVVPDWDEPFTEFYILGTESKAEEYPTNLVIEEKATITAVTVNREHKDMSYRIELAIDGEIYTSLDWMTLSPGEKREMQLEFTPKEIGKQQKLEILLYKSGESTPPQELYLFIDVSTASDTQH